MFRSTYVMLFLRCSISFKWFSPGNYLKSQWYYEKTTKWQPLPIDLRDELRDLFTMWNRIMFVFPSFGNGRGRSGMLMDHVANTAKVWRPLLQNENGANWRRVWLILLALQRPDVKISIHLKHCYGMDCWQLSLFWQK